MIIGLLGKSKSGKSTAAAYLCSNYKCVERALAEPLKKALAEIFLLSDSQLLGTQEQKETPDERWFGCSPRTMMEFVGTDLLRDNLDKIMPGLGPNVFIHNLKIWYSDLIKVDPSVVVVISDVRFQNEVDYIHSMGGHVIKIERGGDSRTRSHKAEAGQAEITNWDSYLKNDLSLEDFYADIKTTFERIMASRGRN